MAVAVASPFEVTHCWGRLDSYLDRSHCRLADKLSSHWAHLQRFKVQKS